VTVIYGAVFVLPKSVTNERRKIQRASAASNNVDNQESLTTTTSSKCGVLIGVAVRRESVAVAGTGLKWFSSYLSGRSFSVNHHLNLCPSVFP